VNGAFDLRVMGLLLRQGRKLHGLSAGLLAIAALWLAAAALSSAHTLGVITGAALWLSLVAGSAQVYYAVRVGFDADLLLALADQARPAGENETAQRDGHVAEAALLDDSLQSLGLLKDNRRGRDWPARWQAMRRLFSWQASCLVLQAGLLVLAWVAAIVRMQG